MSRQETKLLLEGWKKYLKEEPQAGGVVRVFDFDGTLFKLSDAFEEAAGPANFFLPYFNDNTLARVIAKLAGAGKETPVFDKLKEDEANSYDNTYIASLVGSGGFNKNKQYFVDLLTKGDKNFRAVLSKILGIKDTTFEKIAGSRPEPKSSRRGPVDPDWDDDYGYEEDEDELEASLQKEVPPDPKEAERIIKKYLIPFGEDGTPEPDNARREGIKKQLILAALAKRGVSKFPAEHVIVSSNLADTSVDSKTGSVERIAGTSGKFKPGVIVAKAHPNAAGFEVYDNIGTGLAQIKDGIVSVKMPAKEGEEQVRSNPQIDQKLNITSYRVVNGEPVESAGETRNRGAAATGQHTKNPVTQYLALRAKVFNDTLANRKIKAVGNRQIFLDAVKTAIPQEDIRIAYLSTVKDITLNSSADQRPYVGGIEVLFKDIDVPTGLIPPPPNDPKDREVDPKDNVRLLKLFGAVATATDALKAVLDGTEEKPGLLPKIFREKPAPKVAAAVAPAPVPKPEDNQSVDERALYEALKRILKKG